MGFNCFQLLSITADPCEERERLFAFIKPRSNDRMEIISGLIDFENILPTPSEQSFSALHKLQHTEPSTSFFRRSFDFIFAYLVDWWEKPWQKQLRWQCQHWGSDDSVWDQTSEREGDSIRFCTNGPSPSKLVIQHLSTLFPTLHIQLEYCYCDDSDEDTPYLIEFWGGTIIRELKLPPEARRVICKYEVDEWNASNV